MTINIEDDWILPDVSREGVMKSYADEYENRAAGLIQELGQNSFDAYPENIDPHKMKILIQYDADGRIFSWRDFNSTGMGHCNECNWGISLRDETPCKNKSCDWAMYHNIARSGKVGYKLGSRGLGKSLPLQSGSDVYISTKTLDGNAMASIWNKRRISEDEKEWYWKLDRGNKPDHWNQSGTEVRILNLSEDIHNNFIDVNWTIKELQNRWRKMLEKGVKITYILIKNGNKIRRVIKPLKTPKYMESLEGTPNPHIIPNEFVKVGGKIVGEMRNIEIGLARESFEESDQRYGIALVKNGVQTIDILKDLSGWRKIPEELRYNIFGSIDIICTKERPFLNLAEKATHTGYRDHSYYLQVKRQINDRMKKFMEPYIQKIRTKKGIKPISKNEKKEAEEMKDIWNDILSDITELHDFWEGVGKGDEPPPPPTEKEFPYISRIEFENRKWKRGESISIKTVIKNPIPKEKMLNVQWELRDTAPVTIQEQKDSVLLKSGDPKDPCPLELFWRIHLDSSMVPGMYGVRVTLVDSFDNLFKDEEGNIYPQTKMTRALYIEEDPIVIRRKPRTGGGKGKGRAREIIKMVIPFRDPGAPEYECSFEKGIRSIRYNLEGIRYKYLMGTSQHLDKKRKWLPFFEAGAAEIAFEKALWDIDEGNVSGKMDSQEFIEWIAKIFEIEKNILHGYIKYFR